MTEYWNDKGNNLPEINAGYIPLADSALLIMTRELGHDRKFGFQLNLHREVSWANIRDKVNLGLFDCAQMLAPMPIAASLGLGHVREPIIAPFAINLNGNAITVSNTLFSHMRDIDPANSRLGGMASATALAQVVKERSARGLEPLTFAMVFPFSCHNYELRYWLASAGIDPDRDVRLVVIPPSLMAESLKAGHIHGFCAGEPWNSLCVEQGAGRIVAAKCQLWSRSPEKILGLRLAWAERNMDLLYSLLKALSLTAQWLDIPENRITAAKMLSSQTYLGVPQALLERPLSGSLLWSKDGRPVNEENFLVFYRHNANYPWRSHALWLLSQMVRWGQLKEPFDLRQAADIIYRPDIYRAALRETDAEIPLADMKLEGPEMPPRPVGPDYGSMGHQAENFFDGKSFDPSDVIGYLSKFSIRSDELNLELLADYNS